MRNYNIFSVTKANGKLKSYSFIVIPTLSIITFKCKIIRNKLFKNYFISNSISRLKLLSFVFVYGVKMIIKALNVFMPE